jgi:hypothetical protein
VEISASAKSIKSMADSVDSNIVTLSNEIWKELEAASAVESPMLFKPHFNEIIKNDNKSDLKRPMELTAEELNWIFLVKYSLCSINMDLLKPIWLC